MNALGETAQRSLRLRVEGKSNLQGKAAWIEHAADFYVVGVASGSTILEIEAPTLGEAAPEAFEHLPLWENAPRRDQTAFSMVEETLRDAFKGDRDSYLLDRNVLTSVAEFSQVLAFGYDGLSLDGGTEVSAPVTITQDGLATAMRLRDSAPNPVRTVVSGYLDQLRGSDRAFQLVLPGGQRLNGILPSGDPAIYGSFWTKHVVVDGEATFKPSGAPARMLATNIQLASPSDEVYGRLPRPRPNRLDDLRPANPLPAGASGFQRIFGRWPGSETDAEVTAVLAEIS
jgi:hypothetical protein